MALHSYRTPSPSNESRIPCFSDWSCFCADDPVVSSSIRWLACIAYEASAMTQLMR
ncbi:hypothetical protein CPSG_10037 [Coccidioides posadasii str. Silveira]|uniref:Uncharacterized protein n=1 Tax=Coccidioides posadasii (strain RMSCC 757 / Silveira) TaxID=443226 RepID=E9DJP8_COCPS|nr:hypothetical protein CPSG_10037 [Coccidioides posadasii str. Silveira]